MSTVRCDIVLLVWNHLEVTRPCIDSVLRWTDVPARLLVVDNGSISPTKEYLERLRGNEMVEVALLRNETNEGFPRGMNRGIADSTAPYVCLLNNDTVVGPGWLSELLAVAEAQPDIGVVNPSSNTLGQSLGSGQSMEAMAGQLRSQRGQWMEMDSAIGFCMLIKRDVIERIGYLDGAFGVGYFEDTDFCYRAQQAGFRSVQAKAAYVYHEEHRSMDDGWRTSRERQAYFDRNAAIFHARWGRPQRVAYILTRADEQTAAASRAQARQHLRQHAQLWVFHRDEVPDAACLDHSNVMRIRLAGRAWWIQLLWKVLTKKKRYDQCYTDHAALARLFRWLQPLLGMQVRPLRCP